MTIKEIPQQPVQDQQGVMVYGIADADRGYQESQRAYSELVKREQQKSFELGRRKLIATGAVDAARELIDAMREVHPDASFGKTEDGTTSAVQDVVYGSSEDGMVSSFLILWGKEKDEIESEVWKSMEVGMRTLTDELFIESGELRVIPKDIWSGEEGRDVVDESMLNAYHAPIGRSAFNPHHNY